VARSVQSEPFGDDRAVPASPTASQVLGLRFTLLSRCVVPLLRGDQEMPSGETRIVPPSPTATNSPGAQSTASSHRSVPLARAVHVTPSGELRIVPRSADGHELISAKRDAPERIRRRRGCRRPRLLRAKPGAGDQGQQQEQRREGDVTERSQHYCNWDTISDN